MKTLTSLLVYGFAFTLLLVTLYSLYLHESARPSEHDISGNKASVIWNVAGQRSLQSKAEAPRFQSWYRCVLTSVLISCYVLLIDAATIHCVLIFFVVCVFFCLWNIYDCLLSSQYFELHLQAKRWSPLCPSTVRNIDSDEPRCTKYQQSFHPCFLTACTIKLYLLLLHIANVTRYSLWFAVVLILLLVSTPLPLTLSSSHDMQLQPVWQDFVVLVLTVASEPLKLIALEMCDLLPNTILGRSPLGMKLIASLFQYKNTLHSFIHLLQEFN